MPLQSSPIDGAPMRTIRRYGIEIDICPTTGGVWLDRGCPSSGILRQKAA